MTIPFCPQIPISDRKLNEIMGKFLKIKRVVRRPSDARRGGEGRGEDSPSGPSCACGGGADTTTAAVGAAAVTATDIGVARLTNPTGRPLPRFMTAPTAAAGVYCAPPASSGTDAEIGVAFSGRRRLPSGPYFRGLPRFLFPSPLPATDTGAADGAVGAAGAGWELAGVGVSGAGCAASAAAGEASVVAIAGSSLNTTSRLAGPWPSESGALLLLSSQARSRSWRPELTSNSDSQSWIQNPNPEPASQKSRWNLPASFAAPAVFRREIQEHKHKGGEVREEARRLGNTATK